MPDDDKQPKGRSGYFRAAFLFVFSLATILGSAAVFHPESPVPNGWRPHTALQISDQVTPLTGWKLRNAARDPQMCLEAIGQAVSFAPATLEATGDPNCGITTPITVSRVGAARLAPLLSDCGTILRLAMWEHHGLQPLALDTFGSAITEISHIGSYNCRRMRTSRGVSNRYSTHATAAAIDIAGFRLADGRRLSLMADWDGEDTGAAFLRRVQRTSCDWFGLSLGPDYNALHADHFHLQSRGWGGCR